MRKKGLKVLGLAMGMSLSMSLLSHASTFSEYWYQDNQGVWKVRDNNGNTITNAWLCDDAVPSNGQNIWYLIDSNGNMVSAGLVQDQTGNIYSLETSHNGYYGMLRYQSGAYDGVYLDLESSHGGSFANIKNQDGRNGLQAIYGLTQVNIDNSNCVYTSSFRNSYNGGSNNYSNGSQASNTNQNVNQSQNQGGYEKPADMTWLDDATYNRWRSMGKSDDDIRKIHDITQENLEITGGSMEGIHTN